MEIGLINEKSIYKAAEVFAKSWKYSHKEIVSEEFYLSFTPERQRKKLEEHIKKEHSCFVFFEEEKAIGILILDYNLNEIMSIYISPDRLYQGYGSKLIDFALNKLDSKREIYLKVMNVNKAARDFYEKNGFKYSGEIKVLSLEKGLSELKYVYGG